MWKNHFQGIILLSFVLMSIFIANSCGNYSANISKPTSTPILSDFSKCPTHLQTPSRYPFFIGSVFPIGSISSTKYLSGFDEPFAGRIYVKIIWSDHIDSTVISSKDSKYRYEKVHQRVNLLVDEISITEIAFIVDELTPIGPFYVTWSPNLAIGLHNATIQIDTVQGETLEYSWQFCVTDK